MYNISLCPVNRIGDLMAFIHTDWQKNHILSTNEMLMDFQHREYNPRDIYRFVIAVDDSDNIVACLGFIPINNTLFGAIWVKRKSCGVRGLGKQLFDFLEETWHPHAIISIGLGKGVVDTYRSMGYTTGTMNRYSMLKPQTNPLGYIHDIKQIQADELLAIAQHILPRATLPQKDWFYFFKRYIHHPFYKYQYYSVKGKAVMITRILESIGDDRALSLVDYHGDPMHLLGCAASFNLMMECNLARYIICYNVGIDPQIFNNAGFGLNGNDITPIHYEPYEKVNTELIYAYKICNDSYKHIRIFPSDGDQDRPSVVKGERDV